MNLQTQRLLGQQSLAEFMGLHVHLDQVFLDNAKKTGPEIIRKNNFIINTGDNLTAKEREKRIKMNKTKYGLSHNEIKEMKLPKTVNKTRGEVMLTLEQIFNAKSNFSVVEKLEHLGRLRKELDNKLRKIEKKKLDNQLKKKYRPCGLAIVIEKQENPEGEEKYEYVDVVNI